MKNSLTQTSKTRKRRPTWRRAPLLTGRASKARVTSRQKVVMSMGESVDAQRLCGKPAVACALIGIWCGGSTLQRLLQRRTRFSLSQASSNCVPRQKMEFKQKSTCKILLHPRARLCLEIVTRGLPMLQPRMTAPKLIFPKSLASAGSPCVELKVVKKW